MGVLPPARAASSSGQELGGVWRGFCEVGTVKTSAVVHPVHGTEERAVLVRLPG